MGKSELSSFEERAKIACDNHMAEMLESGWIPVAWWKELKLFVHFNFSLGCPEEDCDRCEGIKQAKDECLSKMAEIETCKERYDAD